MMSQLVIISRSIITRLRGQCSQLDTLPLIIEYIVFWGLSAHKVGPSHATRRGGVCGTHTLRPLFHFSLRSEVGGGGFESECESLPKAQVSRNIGVILREMRALLHESERGTECARRRDRSVLCVTRARMESFQIPLCFWCGDSCPRCEGKLQTGTLTGLNGNFY